MIAEPANEMYAGSGSSEDFRYNAFISYRRTPHDTLVAREVQLSLENGYLNITAAKGLDKDEKDKKTGKLIRQERYAGSMSRSFYVGEDVMEEDIKAKLEHGILSLQIPKKETKPQLPEKKYIAIEG